MRWGLSGRQNAGGRPRVPLFNLPPGTQVDIQVRSTSADPPPAIDTVAAVLDETEVE
jgi:hypothetical protein